MPKLIDLTGQKFNRWLVIKRAENNNQNKPTWFCRCKCGTERNVSASSIRMGITKSCGCLQKENLQKMSKTHGKSKYPEYTVWLNIIARCYNEKSDYYHDYGGRGISLCDIWRNDFSLFYKDMGARPSSKHSIDRIDVNGNYEPNNCRWATATEQGWNKRVPRNNKVGVSGVHWYKSTNRWRVTITVNKKHISLGYYVNLDEAIKVRKEAEKLYWNKSS